MVKKTIKKILNTFPYIKTLYQENVLLKENAKFPSGHFYSPIVSVKDLQKRQDYIWQENEKEELEGIDLNLQTQIQLIKKFEFFYPELPFKPEPVDNLRYYFKNRFYSYTDAILLYGMLRHFKPNNIIEIGSGFSSALMMDVNDMFFKSKIKLKFIEPFPTRLKSLMGIKESKNVELIEDNLQNIPLHIFNALEKGDILFIDSSHIVKTGSDVNHILFKILPILNSGVLIHFHDIFYPFEYPKKWVLNGFNWNETYFLKSFLMYNSNYEIILFSDYLHKYYKSIFQNMPLTYRGTGGNLWIMKK